MALLQFAKGPTFPCSSAARRSADMPPLLQPRFRATAPANSGNCRGGDSGGSNKLLLPASGEKKLAATRLSSPSNPFVKHCVKLRLSSSYRRSCGSALVVGLTPILYASKSLLTLLLDR